MDKFSVGIMTLESIESLGISGREVVEKEKKSSVVIGTSFSTWSLVMSFSIALLVNSLISLSLVEFSTLMTANSLGKLSLKKQTS